VKATVKGFTDKQENVLLDDREKRQVVVHVWGQLWEIGDPEDDGIEIAE
jgi:hypothetical protein